MEQSLESLRRCRILCSTLGSGAVDEEQLLGGEVEVVEVADQVLGEPVGNWEKLETGTRVISISAEGKDRTLHSVGKCWRVPGLHFARYAVLGTDEVGEFSRLCKDCYPAGIESSSNEADSESDSSDSSSSSD